MAPDHVTLLQNPAEPDWHAGAADLHRPALVTSHPGGPDAADRMPRVRVRMAASTVAGLRRAAYALYVFRGVATAGTAFPLVWQRRETFGGETEVTLAEGLRVFASDAAIGEGIAITGGGEYTAWAGQTLEVVLPDGRGPVESRGAPGMVTVVNTTHQQMVCGLSSRVGKEFARSCVLPLYARHACVLAPVNRVLLAIGPAGPRAGCLTMRAPGEAVLLDLSGGVERSVDFDQVRGWSWERGARWADVHPAGTSLVSLLVERTPELHDARAVALERLAHQRGWRG
jgi:hypothetical protein